MKEKADSLRLIQDPSNEWPLWEEKAGLDKYVPVFKGKSPFSSTSSVQPLGHNDPRTRDTFHLYCWCLFWEGEPPLARFLVYVNLCFSVCFAACQPVSSSQKENEAAGAIWSSRSVAQARKTHLPNQLFSPGLPHWSHNAGKASYSISGSHLHK